MATCEAIWLHNLLEDIGFEFSSSTQLLCDNLSNIHIANNPIFHARTKHIEVHYHFVREKVLAGQIDLQHIGTHEQVADIFTKALAQDKFEKFRRTLRIKNIELSLKEGVNISSSS